MEKNRRKESRICILEHPELEHEVVDIETFIDSPRHLNAGRECWLSVKEDLKELFRGNYNEAVFCEGIGAGKSYKSSIIITYMVYKTLCLRDPQSYFKLAKGSNICFTNMSIRADQSRKVVFGEVNARINNSPWFRKYNRPNPRIKTELQFSKNITIFPGNSEETFPLGFNVLGGVMDEAAWYTDIQSHDVAEEIYNGLHNRIKNRFGDEGLLVMISSPRYVDDFIEKKMQEAEINKKIFARRRTLWDAKPKSAYSGKLITIEGHAIPEEFAIEANRNFGRFKRDFMAMPSLAVEPYFKQSALVEQTIDPNYEHPVDEQGRFKPLFKGKGKLYNIHVDLSHKRDATGFAMAHNDGNIIVIDLMYRIKAPVGGEINFSKIRDMIKELQTREFNIYMVTYDGYQSLDSIQILKQQGLRSEILSVDLSVYDTLQDRMYCNKLKSYRYEPFFEEIRRLEFIDGIKVDHPRNGSKDVVDAVAGAVYTCVKNPNNFSCWVAGSSRQVKTAEEQAREAAVLPVDGLVPYGYFRGRRMG